MAWALVLLVLLALLVSRAGRRRELFLVSVRRGRLLAVRGRVPQGLLADLRPQLRHVQRGTLVVRSSPHGPELETHGIDERAAQRLRNLVGLRSEAQFVGAAPIHQPTLGQRLGITWLAWWCDRSP